MTFASTLAQGPATVLDSFLRPSLYIPELQSHKKPEVLEELVHALAAAGLTRHPVAVQALLLQREELGTTGIGKGIAVPHARSTLVTDRAVLVARSSRGVDYDAVDGEPVRLLFLTVAPPMERDPIYLKLLAEIVRGVRLVRVRRRLLEARDFESVREVLVHAAAE